MNKKDLRHITKQKLFIGSGVDDLVDSNLHTKLDRYGQYVVDYNDAKSNKILNTVMNSDVSRNENDIAKDLFSQTPKIHHSNIIGYYLDLYVGHVQSGSYRKKASSGGVVSWVAVELLKKGDIDGFIHVKKSITPGILFEYGISRTIEDIQSGAKSRYYPAELSKVLKEVKEKPGKYAVVGIPEIITELRLLAEDDEIIRNRIKYYFGLVCGHQKTTKYAEAIAWEYGIKPGDLQDIDFRVKKDSGRAIEYDMQFTGKVEGRQKTFIVRNNEPFVSNWAHGFFKARFSDFTDNSFNEVADITFGDAWLEEYEGDPMGNNIMIIRNRDIAKLINQGIKKSNIKADKVDEEVILRSQRGLIHHTRDELPYRLHKENDVAGWAPTKRVLRNSRLDEHRKKVQDIRQVIAEKSHTCYQEAVEEGTFENFKKRMQPYVDRYNDLYQNHQTNTPQGKVAALSQKARALMTSVDRGVSSYLDHRAYKHADGAILTLTGYYNYGNVLQRYALQKYLRKNGYNFVSYVDLYAAPRDIYRVGRKKKIKTPLRAVKRFINYQKPYWYTPKFGEMYPEAGRLENIIDFVNKYIWIKPFDPRDDYKSYIVGSDQVWRNWWNDREKLGYYFFNFLKGRKVKRIAYAASFGNEKIEDIMRVEDVEYLKPYIDSFDNISVRERSGVDLIKSVWGIDYVAETVDPTLLLDAKDYSEIIDNSDAQYEKIQPIFTYVLGETPKVKKFIRTVQDRRRQSAAGIRAHGGAEGDVLPPVELWLKGFRDAELVITNSFHGMMFSIINNTDFIIIGRSAGGLSRIVDFLSSYSIEGRFVDESDIDNFDISTLKPINWAEVNKTLNYRRTESGKWLLDSVKNTSKN